MAAAAPSSHPKVRVSKRRILLPSSGLPALPLISSQCAAQIPAANIMSEASVSSRLFIPQICPGINPVASPSGCHNQTTHYLRSGIRGVQWRHPSIQAGDRQRGRRLDIAKARHSCPPRYLAQRARRRAGLHRIFPWNIGANPGPDRCERAIRQGQHHRPNTSPPSARTDRGRSECS